MSYEQSCHGWLRYEDESTLEETLQVADETYQRYAENGELSYFDVDNLQREELTLKIDIDCSAPASASFGAEGMVDALIENAIDGWIDLGYEESVERKYASKSVRGRRETWWYYITRESWDRIEGERQKTDHDDHLWLQEKYWTLDDWDQKAALLYLVCDQRDACLKPIMLDSLRVPDAEPGDMRHAALCTAIFFLSPSYYLFEESVEEAYRVAATLLAESES